jgi:uncharacterized MAPEG superfamily protein
VTNFLMTEAGKWYALACFALVLNMAGIANFTAIVRLRAKRVVNPEDAKALKGEVADEEHPSVLRVQRAHRNAVENIPLFFVVGLLYALSGPSPTGAISYFAVYAGSRVLHSIFYIKGLQPFRTIAFVIGQLALLGMMVHVVRVLFS